jgi:hypothetical protein
MRAPKVLGAIGSDRSPGSESGLYHDAAESDDEDLDFDELI